MAARGLLCVGAIRFLKGAKKSTLAESGAQSMAKQKPPPPTRRETLPCIGTRE